jgi:putative oxidoreductase
MRQEEPVAGSGSLGAAPYSIEPMADLHLVLAAMSSPMYALLRAAIGLALIPHGLRSCFGFFPTTGKVVGFAAMVKAMEASGYRPGAVWASIAGAVIFAAGPLLALGLFTRPAAVFVCLFLALGALDKARSKGYFCNNNGLEFPLLWSLTALFFAIHGGGALSLDHWLMMDRSP